VVGTDVIRCLIIHICFSMDCSSFWYDNW